jgi:sulfate transport system ATP-binding protein
MSIVLEHLTKHIGGHRAVNGVSLEVGDGELYVLLGPSGSGKSTLLRLIAGLADLDAGRVVLRGRDVTELPPSERGVGFVFQNYALFSGMTVAENVEFALQIRGVGAADRRRRRDELLDLVGLTGLGGRTSRQLSGGQQQRVAIARALAHRPQVLLLDEPFGALDARVRLELRRTLRTIQQEVGVSTIFVTHDQEEAFELADRMGVLNFGRLLEEGPPQELYLHPETEFVASFLGTANLMVGQCTPEGVCLGPVRFSLGTRAEPSVVTQKRVQVLFRPEDVALRESVDDLNCPALGRGVVDQRVFVGSFERLRLRLPPLAGVRSIAPPIPFGSREMLVEASRTQDQARRQPLSAGDQAWVGVRRVHALVHPGLRFLLLVETDEPSSAAVRLGGDLARLSQARVGLLGCGETEALAEPLRAAREGLGIGLTAIDARSAPGPWVKAVAEEVARQPTDLVIAGALGRDRVEIAGRLLAVGVDHLLLTPEREWEAVSIQKILICVAIGEPGKADVSFTGRLARHLGAAVTILTVVAQQVEADSGRAQRFLDGNARTLTRQGVIVETSIRRGAVADEILAERDKGGYDLVVLGAPLPGSDGRINLDGPIGRLIREANVPLLIVRSPEAAS